MISSSMLQNKYGDFVYFALIFTILFFSLILIFSSINYYAKSDLYSRNKENPNNIDTSFSPVIILKEISKSIMNLDHLKNFKRFKRIFLTNMTGIFLFYLLRVLIIKTLTYKFSINKKKISFFLIVYLSVWIILSAAKIGTTLAKYYSITNNSIILTLMQFFTFMTFHGPLEYFVHIFLIYTIYKHIRKIEKKPQERLSLIVNKLTVKISKSLPMIILFIAIAAFIENLTYIDILKLVK